MLVDNALNISIIPITFIFFKQNRINEIFSKVVHKFFHCSSAFLKASDKQDL